MTFEITKKVALITGASSGLGYHIAKTLLTHGLKGVAILDVDEEKGQAAEEEFKKEFGSNSCIFIKTDVSVETQLEEAFKKATDTFKQLDIVINNAAIISEINWRKCIDINVGGCVAGTKLAIDTYLPMYKSGFEGVIINIASIVGIQPLGITPVYTATKQAIVALSRAYGVKEHYDETKVRVLAICPGYMKTPMTMKPKPENANMIYIARYKGIREGFPLQEPEFPATCLLDIIKEGQNGSVWVIEGGQPAYEVEFTDRHRMRKN